MSNKRFKLRFSFQFCGSKHHSSTKQAIYKLSSAAFNPKTLDITYCNFPNPPPSTPTHHPSIVRHVSPNTVSNGCGYSTNEKPRRKVYRPSSEYGDTDDDFSVTPLLKFKNRSNAKTKKKKKKIKFRTSTSSGDSGWFTSEEISSRSFSNDSSNNDQLFNRSKHNAKKIASRSFWNDSSNNAKKISSKSFWNESSHNARMISSRSFWNESSNNDQSKDRKLNSSAPCKVRESVAVEKKSEDPYEDFRRSMMEMIMEKQLFEVHDLEELLRCFLALNSRHHHGVIVEAFSEIWVALFSRSSDDQVFRSMSTF